MPGNGRHIITSSDPPPAPHGMGPPKPPGVLHVIFYLWLFIILISAIIKCSQPPLTPPTPPEPRVAVFEASNSSTITPIVVVLGGGSYEITYESAEKIDAIKKAATAASFIADFSKGEQSGDLHNADVLILIGALNLSVGSISGNDSLYANVISRGKTIRAYFNFSPSPGGPPWTFVKQTRKKIIVVGELRTVVLGDSREYAKTEISILDLGIDKRKQEQYSKALDKYNMENQEYRNTRGKR